MEKYGIPASISLAQGLIESRAGSSKLAVNNNNHFGIKCFSRHCRKGHCTNFTDDTHKDFFRKFPSPWESWRAHSQLLSSGRYTKLRKNGRSEELVEAFDQVELFATPPDEIVAVFPADLDGGFEAIGRKSGAKHQQPFGAAPGQVFDRPNRVGLRPGVATEPALKTNGIARLLQSEFFGNSPRSGIALR